MTTTSLRHKNLPSSCSPSVSAGGRRLELNRQGTDDTTKNLSSRRILGCTCNLQHYQLPSQIRSFRDKGCRHRLSHSIHCSCTRWAAGPWESMLDKYTWKCMTWDLCHGPLLTLAQMIWTRLQRRSVVADLNSPGCIRCHTHKHSHPHFQGVTSLEMGRLGMTFGIPTQQKSQSCICSPTLMYFLALT